MASGEAPPPLDTSSTAAAEIGAAKTSEEVVRSKESYMSRLGSKEKRCGDASTCMVCGVSSPALAARAPMLDSAAEIDAGQKCEAVLQPKYIEVLCKSSGNIQKFAPGTEAGFALHLINCKLPTGVPLPLYIEAAKEGEEPIWFSPKAILADCGQGWRLQTVIEEGQETATLTQQIPKPPLSALYIEVLCKSSGKIQKFAPGAEVRFALHLINSKLPAGVPQALYIEAAKEGEEPIYFVPEATLANCGEGWKLRTIIEEGHNMPSKMQPNPLIPKLPLTVVKEAQHKFLEKTAVGSSSNLNFQYLTKILIVFAFMFLLGGLLAFFLENLPWLIHLVSSS
ncbi:hypothetical protein AXF42_Ash002579 [Apostasia shenzhenica]|uniref:Uncharacterized protein n=1 Tax=Apostasia shenzhenica TaxID=1088818 RepID=A0A2I0AP34_9ASPA|nr:hypothetical protein AXF42_Ash002579 [Apostasia shenzhenica]